MRSRNYKGLNNDIEDVRQAAALSHMAKISYRTGRKLVFDPVNETFGSDAEANRYLSREYRRPFVVPARV